jgi:gliding motility-associated-like protein
MTRFKRSALNIIIPLMLLLGLSDARAVHIIGGEITWTCEGNGQYRFFLKLYRDCTENTFINPNQTLQVLNNPNLTSIPMTLQSQTDITQPGCGVACNGAQSGQVAVEEFVFASQPISLGGVPPAEGFIFVFNQCCRNTVQNLVNADNYTINYRATMYPLNGMDSSPCYDSSPQFEERPSALLCTGYTLNYNSNATDVDGDSLGYAFVAARHEQGNVPYEPGYTFETPLPGPGVNPTYQNATLDAVTGQMVYQAPAGLQGRWNVAYAVRAYRCGQLISENIREMQVYIIPCTEPNNVPQVPQPIWTSPAGASGYSVTVDAGEFVSFTITGTDNDVINGNPQQLSFDASGVQFGTGFTNENAGCLIAPCATLGSGIPPSVTTGTVETLFEWQTECQHVAVFDQCANYSNTYNFIFKYRDDYCPARATNFVNISITVIGEEVLPGPQPHCANTLPTGEVVLSWAPVTDSSNPPSFVEYVIFHSLDPNGPFTETGTVPNINTGTYTHAGASTTGANYYQIRTRSGCNGAVLSPAPITIASVFLVLNNAGETADLSWNAVATPPLPSSNGNGQGLYQIFKEYPEGTWTQIGSTFDLFFSDPVTVCNEYVSYYVQLTDNLPCTSTSNVVGDTLNNPATPSPTVMDSVSVEQDSQWAELGWQPNQQLNVTSYSVEQTTYATITPWVPQDTIYGYDNTTWLNVNSTAATGSECYRVRAFNSCPNSGAGLASARHCTMYLEAEADGCERRASLIWNPYVGWEEGIREYEVLVSRNGAPEEIITTVTDTVFEHTGVDAEATYCYRVRAVRNIEERITSTSNEACVYIYVPKRPDFSYFYNATVNEESDAVETFFFVDSTAGYIGFDVLRGTEPGNIARVGSVDFSLLTRYFDYTDNSARVNTTSYYYTVVGIDSCEQYADTMNILRTILLEADARSDRTNRIDWNAFEGWLGDVTGQNIWRNYDGTWELIATVPPSQFSYIDPIEEFVTGEGRFCYYIEAMEGEGPVVSPDGVSFQEMSRSNIACALQLPNVFLPNAFVPEGVNQIFLPVTVYVDYSNYLFQVFDRWGGVIFLTDDPLTGWDGTVKAKPAQQGVYGYHVHFVSSTGQVYEKSGTVTLIR